LLSYYARMVDSPWEVDLKALVNDIEKETGLKPKELAALLGFNLKTYYQWRNGDTEPDGQSVAKLFIYIKRLEVDKGIRIEPKFKYWPQTKK